MIDPVALSTRHDELKTEQPKLRARDAARSLGVSEAELVAARCGDGVTTRLRPAWDALIRDLESLGEVMGLTRNEHAVIEKDGQYRNVELFDHGGNVLDEGLDLRIFRHRWASAYAVTNDARELHSLQIFGADGTAYHKVFKRGDRARFDEFVARHRHDDQRPGQAVEPAPRTVEKPDDAIDRDGMIARWAELKDTHEFYFLLRKFGVTRTQALRLAEGAEGPGGPWTRRVSLEAHRQLFAWARDEDFPIMIFVGNPGMIEIHTGPVKRLKPTGDWFNIMDPGFNLHLHEPGIDSAWVVRKPTSDGIVTSLELYDPQGENILLSFSKRKPGQIESSIWAKRLADLDSP